MKSLRQRSLFLGFFLVVLAGCTEEERGPAAAFYYPLAKLTDGLVYEYLPVEADNSPPFYYYHRSFLEEDSTILTTMFYDYAYQPFQFSRERIYANGAVLKDMKLFFPDSTSNKQSEITVQIEAGNVFPFHVSAESGVLLTHLEWEGPEPERTTQLIRNRRYLRDTTWVMDGQTLPALQFDLKEAVAVDEEGVTDVEYGGMEIYARGLGLVYFKKKISDSFVVEYALNDTFSMLELERRFKNTLE